MLIELRIAPGKGKIRRKIQELRRDFGLSQKSVIPHISIYGDFQLSPGKFSDLVKGVERAASGFDSVHYVLDDFEIKPNEDKRGNVIAFHVKLSPELFDLRQRIIKELSGFAPSNKSWDRLNIEPWFHITIANHVTSSSDRIRRQLEENPEIRPSFYCPLDALRVTVLHDNRTIAFEYDLMLKSVLNRAQALDRRIWARTLLAYRKKDGFELLTPNHKTGKKTYLTSDLHLDHENIIRYCARPFANCEEMNRILINNWNFTVKPSDYVLFLGDLTFGRGSRPASYWLSKLNGKIVYISGNHESGVPGHPYVQISYGGYDFLLVHSPHELPIHWNGWVIHGHIHNNNIRDFPFINGEKKTINVSPELTNYLPVDLDFLVSLDINKIKRMDTISSFPVKLA